MSGMFDSKTDKANRKQARTEKEIKSKKKSRRITITVITVLLLVSALAILFNSNFIRHTLPVVSIDGVNFSTTKFEYYFNSQVNEYVNMMSQFQGFGSVPDTNRSLSNQIYDHTTGQTWADFFMEPTFTRMANITSLYNAAQAYDGFSLSQEHYQSIDDDIAAITEFIEEINADPMYTNLTVDLYLQRTFGSSMNEREYRKISEFNMTAMAFSEYMYNKPVYDSERLAEYYSENKDLFDVIGYRLLYVNPEVFSRDDFETEEEFDEAVEAALLDARARAAAIASSGISNADDFIAASEEEYGYTAQWIDDVQYQIGENLDTSFSEWLLSDSRKYADIFVVDNDNGSIVIFFDSRNDNNYKTVGMRQILILREEVNVLDFESEADPLYIAAQKAADADAQAHAEYINSLFIAAHGTLDALNNLMEEHNDDLAPNGEHLNIALFDYRGTGIRTMKVVPEIEEWLFESGREIGDSELIHTERFGYHLIYFTGFGETMADIIADDRLRSEEHTLWLESLTPGTPVKHTAFFLVHV